eukprot:m.256403 g.256403  ORF g.256403 m.256403 type:complete len:244 (-) comp34352_c0_seq1:512-1243(-)
MFASLFVVASALLVPTVAGNGVPLFGWSSEASMFKDSSSVQAGVTIKSADVLSNHMQSTESSIVIFVQDGLSLDYISARSSEMKYVKNSMESAASSIFVPSVSGLESVFGNKNVVRLELPYEATGEVISAALAKLEVAPTAVFLTGSAPPVTVSRRTRSTSGFTNRTSGLGYCVTKACRTYRSSGTSAPIVGFASIPVLTALPSLFVMVIILISGIFGLMVLENNDKFPSVDDVYLIISTRNE